MEGQAPVEGRPEERALRTPCNEVYISRYPLRDNWIVELTASEVGEAGSDPRPNGLAKRGARRGSSDNPLPQLSLPHLTLSQTQQLQASLSHCASVMSLDRAQSLSPSHLSRPPDQPLQPGKTSTAQLITNNISDLTQPGSGSDDILMDLLTADNKLVQVAIRLVRAPIATHPPVQPTPKPRLVRTKSLGRPRGLIRLKQPELNRVNPNDLWKRSFDVFDSLCSGGAVDPSQAEKDRALPGSRQDLGWPLSKLARPKPPPKHNSAINSLIYDSQSSSSEPGPASAGASSHRASQQQPRKRRQSATLAIEQPLKRVASGLQKVEAQHN